MLCGCVCACVRHCQSNYCSMEKNVNRQTTDGGCHIDFNTRMKHDTHRLAHMKGNGHTHTKKSSKVVEDVDLSYLSLTAVTLEEMKRKRRGRKQSRSMEREDEQKEAERRMKETARESIFSYSLHCVYIFTPPFNPSLKKKKSLSVLSFSPSGRP